MIRAIQHHGILQLPHLIQIIQHPPNLGINRRNQRVITRQTALQAIGIWIGQRIPTPIGQTRLHKLGLADKATLKIINRTIGQHHLIGIVHIKMLCRRRDRCMGPLKTHVQKKRPLIVTLLQKCQRFITRIMLNRMLVWQFGWRTAIHRIFLPGSGRAFFVKIRQSQIFQILKIVCLGRVQMRRIAQIRISDALKTIFIPAPNHVRLADHSRLISVSPKLTRQRIGIRLGNLRMIIAKHPMRMAILPGHKTDPRWRTNRIIAESACKHHPLIRNAIHIRSPDIWMPGKSRTIGIVLIRHQPQHIGSSRHKFLLSKCMCLQTVR